MYSLFRSIEEIGSITLSEIWFPILIWTILATAILAFLNLKKDLKPLYHYHLRIATILSLPAGILLSQIFLNIVRNIIPTTEADFLFTINNPLQVTEADFVINASIDLESPLFWIGLISILIAVISVIYFCQVIYNIYKLNQIRKSLDFTLLNSISGLNEENLEIISRLNQDVLIAFTDLYASPFTFGWNKPVIVIPNFLKKDPEALNLIIAHELIHIRRKDYHIHLVVSLISAAFTFHPLFTYVKRQINDFREISCDQEVISEFHASPKTYAKLIFSLMENTDHEHNLQVSLAQYNSNLKKRISTMKYHSLYRSSYKKSVLFIALLSVAIMLPIACTEMSSEIDTPENTFNEIPPSPPPIDFKSLDHEDVILKLDGKAITYIELEETMTLDEIQSIDVVTIEEGKKIVSLTSKKSSESIPPPPPPMTNNSFTSDAEVFSVVEEMPKLIGGETGLKSKINYPERAVKDGIEGRVIITFVVTKDGNVRDAQIVRGIGAGCDEEALRVIKNSKFEPGKQRGRNVDVQFTLPVVFKLDN